MLKRIFKAVTVAVTILCLVVCMFPTYAFADVVEFTEAAKMGATIVDIYGMANNTSLAYDYMTEGSALTLIENLYTEYSSSASDPYTLAAIGAAAAAAGTIAVVYDAITGQGYVQFYQEQYVSSLDGFWDYTLSDLGLTRNQDGYFEYALENGSVVNVSISGAPSSFPNQPLNLINPGTSWQNAYEASVPYYHDSYVNPTYHRCFVRNYGTVSDTYGFFYNVHYVGTNNSNLSFSPCFVSLNQLQVGDAQKYGSSYSGSLITLEWDSTYQVYHSNGSISGSASNGYVLDLPVFDTMEEGITAALDVLSGRSPAAFLQPEFYVGDPLTAVPTIDIPNVADPDYLPQPITIPTNIPWNPLWGDPLPDGVSNPVPGTPYPVTDPSILNDAVPDIWKSIVEGDVTVEPEPEPEPDPDPDPENPNPDEVFNPLLPVTLPSFNFSFSGIWHYVREWVASLGAWFTTLFLIWSKLPYAMVVPVYATAVVVIVLGVYKRFFM